MSEDSLVRAVQVAKDIAEMRTQVSEMHRLLIGNGDLGLVRRVNDIEMAMAKQLGIVAGAATMISVVISVIGWKIKSWLSHP